MAKLASCRCGSTYLNSPQLLQGRPLGYFTDNRIIDLGGLIDPIITEHIVTDGFEWGFWHYKPDYYIYAEEFDWALSNVKSGVNDYTVVQEIARDNFPTPIYILERNVSE